MKRGRHQKSRDMVLVRGSKGRRHLAIEQDKAVDGGSTLCGPRPGLGALGLGPGPAYHLRHISRERAKALHVRDHPKKLLKLHYPVRHTCSKQQ